MTLNQAKTPLFRKMGLFQLFPMATILVSLHFLIIFYVSNIPLAFAQNENQFIYNGFHPAKLHLDGTAQLLSNSLLQLTNIKNISSPKLNFWNQILNTQPKELFSFYFWIIDLHEENYTVKIPKDPSLKVDHIICTSNV